MIDPQKVEAICDEIKQIAQGTTHHPHESQDLVNLLQATLGLFFVGLFTYDKGSDSLIAKAISGSFEIDRALAVLQREPLRINLEDSKLPVVEAFRDNTPTGYDFGSQLVWRFDIGNQDNTPKLLGLDITGPRFLPEPALPSTLTILNTPVMVSERVVGVLQIQTDQHSSSFLMRHLIPLCVICQAVQKDWMQLQPE